MIKISKHVPKTRETSDQDVNTAECRTTKYAPSQGAKGAALAYRQDVTHPIRRIAHGTVIPKLRLNLRTSFRSGANSGSYSRVRLLLS
jgi:hypothetical protein